MTKIHLHINGAALFAAGAVIYGALGYRWGLFAVLLFAPDIFMLGYLLNNSIGGLVYNIGHSLIWPAIFILIGLTISAPTLISLGIIWACHIGLDHAFGYGYKYPDAFKHTHFSEL